MAASKSRKRSNTRKAEAERDDRIEFEMRLSDIKKSVAEVIKLATATQEALSHSTYESGPCVPYGITNDMRAAILHIDLLKAYLFGRTASRRGRSLYT